MLAVRPPEYFPRLAYLALIDGADRFVLADTFQYSRQSFQNRARLRTPQGRQWISIPLQGGQHGRPIREARVNHDEPWARKHWRAFEYNYRSTPYFEYYEDRFRPLFEDRPEMLAPLTTRTVRLLADLFAIETPLVLASDLDGAPATLPDVLAALDADALVVPPEAADRDGAAAPTTHVLTFEEAPYRQNFDGFEPGLSAVDLLFNYGPQAPSLLREMTAAG